MWTRGIDFVAAGGEGEHGREDVWSGPACRGQSLGDRAGAESPGAGMFILSGRFTVHPFCHFVEAFFL